MNRLKYIAPLTFLFQCFFISFSQTLSDGPIELKTRVRDINVTYSPPADASLNFGGQVGFNPDEFTFKVWSQDNANFSGLGWQGGNCLQDNFDPPLASMDFNYMLFNYIYPTSTVPQFFEIRMDSWQDNCGSDGGSVGFPCPGNRCTFDVTCCCVTFIGCAFSTGDNHHCNSNPFKTQMDYRLGPPCQWYSHGYVGTSGCTDYQPHIESYWRYMRGTSCDTAISLGNIVQGGAGLSHFNSNECYSNNYPASAGNDVFYEFTVTQPIGLKISLCAAATFSTNLYLLNSSCTQIAFNDSFCTNTSEIQTAACIPGTYYIVVDGDSAFDMGTFTLSITEDASQIVKADAGADKSICYGNTATIGGSPAAFGGVPAYTYQWSPANFLSDSDTANPQAFPPPGIAQYVLFVTDSAGCTVSDTMKLTVNPGPNVNLGNDTTICNGDTIQLNAGGGYLNYFWSNGAITPSIKAAIANLYFVYVIDLNGCIGKDTMQLFIHPSSSLNLGNDTSICIGDSAIFNAGNYANYQWNTGDTTSFIKTGSAGNYSVQTIDSNNCSYSDTINLAVNSLPLISLGNDTTICPTTAITLNPGGGYTSYLWNDNSNNQTLSVSSSGNYFVKVSNAFNCFNSDTLNVSLYPQPSVNLGADTNICLGNSLTINAGSGFSNYFWNTAATTSSISIISGGTYWVVVSDANSCTTSDTIFVAQNPQISFSLNSSSDVTCNGLSNGTASVTTAGGSIPYSYLWSSGQTSPSLSGLNKGIYTVTVTDSKGCTNSLTIFIDEPQQLLMSFTTTDPLCVGVNSGKVDVITYGGTSPYTYLWTYSADSAWSAVSDTINGLSPGNYQLTITDADSCSLNQSFTINTPEPIFIDAVVTNTSCTGGDNGSVELNIFGGKSPYFFSWSNGKTEKDLKNISKGSYSVTITDINGCTGTKSADVEELKIKIDGDLITVPNVFTPNGDNANDFFRVVSEIENISEYDMTIFNRWGELIFKTADINAKWDGKYKGKDVADGVYFCSLRLSVKCLGNNEVITKTSSVTLIR